MKLINKFLTALAPVAMVGVLTPTLVSCNNTKTFTINYADSVNCKDPDAENYHSLTDVQNAIKLKIDVETEHKQVKISDINAALKEDWYQIFYYEIIASYTLCKTDEPGLTLTEWKEEGGSITGFTLNGLPIVGGEKNRFTYVENTDDEKVWITYNGVINIPSYRYHLCTVTGD